MAALRSSRASREETSGPSTSPGCTYPVEREIVLDELRYQEARDSVRSYWERRLAHGARIVVPEQRVMDAQRNLLIQNLALTWRYSVGNRYEQLSTPEGVDVARVLTGYGHLGVEPLDPPARLSARSPPSRSRRRSAGARTGGWAHGWSASPTTPALSGDTAADRCALRRSPQLRQAARTPDSARVATDFSSASATPPTSRHRVFGLHSQAVVWQGLRSMGQVWQETGYTQLAATCRAARAQARSADFGAPSGARNAGCRAGRSSSRSRCSTASARIGRSPLRAAGATGTSSCRTRSRPGFFEPHGAEGEGHPRLPATATAPACSDASAPARTASTGLRRATRSPARAPCTD